MTTNSLGNSQYFYDVNDAKASGKRQCSSCKPDANSILTAFQRAIIQSYGLPVALGDLNGNGLVDYNDWQRSCNKRCYRTGALWGRDVNEVRWNLGLFIEAAQEANDVNAVRNFKKALKSL